jgi:hypothetical protein
LMKVLSRPALFARICCFAVKPASGGLLVVTEF